MNHRSLVPETVIYGVVTLIAFSALLLIGPLARAQNETVLHSFTGNPDGSEPLCGLTPDGKGNLYGTTEQGGLGYGTVYKLSPDGNAGWTEAVLYSFTGGADGADPFYSGLILDSMGNLYGTTYNGGVNGYGVVFELSPTGTKWTENVLYSFANDGDGANPAENLIMDSARNLYGATWNDAGGPVGVFELTPHNGGWTEHLIYRYFAGNPTGLTMDAAGNIFGIGGLAVFELVPNGKGGWNSTVVYTFTGDNYPSGTLVLDQIGDIYGTTVFGGANNAGTVYQLSPGEKGKWLKRILHSFRTPTGQTGRDGNEPIAGVVIDANRNLYGTTFSGGMYGEGTVFELVAPVGFGDYKERILWEFNGTEGAAPEDQLVMDGAHNLYGTTAGGGLSGHGVVFEISP